MTHRSLVVPESVVTTEAAAMLGGEVLNVLAAVEGAGSTGWLGARPLARVLGNPVIEEFARNVVNSPGGLCGGIAVVGAAEAERGALARRNLGEGVAQVGEGTRGGVSRKIDEEGYSLLGEGRRGENREENEGVERLHG